MFARTFRPAANMVRSSMTRGKSTFVIPTKQLNSDHKSEIAVVSSVFIGFLVAGGMVSNLTANNILRAHQMRYACYSRIEVAMLMRCVFVHIYCPDMCYNGVYIIDDLKLFKFYCA